MAGEIYSRMLEREKQGIKKIQEVVEFATDDDCKIVAILSSSIP